MSSTNRGSQSTIAIVAVIAMMALGVFALMNIGRIVDQLAVWQYTPTEQVANYPATTGMSSEGKFYLYASQPEVKGVEDFNQYCTKAEPTTAILGCYVTRKIYLYDVTNKQLDGIMDVTSAHEMLHAVYERMSQSERKRVGELVEAEYNTLKNDENFSARMAIYERIEPGQRENELFSIIGTEAPKVSSELEAIYGKYFDDRAKVVALADKYQSVFDRLKERSDQLVREMTNLAAEIEKSKAVYEAESNDLSADIGVFNSRAESGAFVSQSSFNAARNTLIARSADIEKLRVSINSLIDEYNVKQEELRGLSVETERLNQSINSSIAPAPGVQ